MNFSGATGLQSVVEYLVLAAGAIGALGVIGLVVRKAYRRLVAAVTWMRKLGDLVERELTHNHGSSMKDQVADVRDFMAESSLDRADLHRRLDALLRRTRHLHPDVDWRAAERGEDV